MSDYLIQKLEKGEPLRIFTFFCECGNKEISLHGVIKCPICDVVCEANDEVLVEIKKHKTGPHGTVGWDTQDGLICAECGKIIKKDETKKERR